MKSLGYITLKEASELSGIGSEALKKRCQEGKIPGALKQGKTWFVPRSEVVKDETAGTDFYIDVLSKLAESGLGFGVTLFVNGVIVSGDLISSKKYIHEVNKAIIGSGDHADDKTKSVVTNLFEKFFKAVTDKIDEGGEDRLIKHLHMNNVEVFADSSDTIGFTDGLLRIKKDQIDGFIWGRGTPAE